MIFVTKALKSTVGEDNSNAETYVFPQASHLTPF